MSPLPTWIKGQAGRMDLAGHVEDRAEEQELEALIDAIMEWDKKDHDPSARQEQPGSTSSLD